MKVIYFGNDWSAENRTSSHHIAKQLSRQHDILYVECPGLRAPKGNKRDIVKVFKKLSSLFKKPVRIADNLTVYTMIQIPFHSNRLVAQINIFLSTYLLKKVCRRNKFNSSILWFVVPHAGHLMGRLDEVMSVYYCIDDYSALPDVNVEAVTKMDRILSTGADIVFTASRSLTESKKNLNKKVFYSPHGVEFEHFNQVYTKEFETPSDIMGLAKPIIGFFGLIEAWIDLDLIEKLAKHYQHVSIVVIGRAAVDVQRLEKLDNIYFLGKKSFSALPAYAKQFNVCILPYVDNNQIFNCNPIKLKEYLATGKPIVSVSFPEIAEYKDVVYIAETTNEFIEHINSSLVSDSSEKSENRVNSVKNLTWENRVTEVMEKVEKEYKKKLISD